MPYDDYGLENHIQNSLSSGQTITKDREDCLIKIMLDKTKPSSIRSMARNQIIQANARLVYSAALIYSKKYRKPLSDLYQAAMSALLNCSTSYDPTRGVRFMSYAIWWVMRGMQEEVCNQNDMVHVPCSTKANKLKLLYSGKLDLEKEKERRFYNAVLNVASLDSPYHSVNGKEPEGTTLSDLLEYNDDKFDSVLTDELSRKLGDILKTVLDKREYQTLKMFFQNELLLSDIGSRLGVSEERARQLKTNALRKMKSYLIKQKKDNKFDYEDSDLLCNLEEVFK